MEQLGQLTLLSFTQTEMPAPMATFSEFNSLSLFLGLIIEGIMSTINGMPKGEEDTHLSTGG